MFSSLRRVHWCVAFCAVSRLHHHHHHHHMKVCYCPYYSQEHRCMTMYVWEEGLLDCDTLLDGTPSVDDTSSNKHRSIARYRPTIVLTAPGGRSVHSIRWSQIGSESRFLPTPPAFDAPVRKFPLEYCHAVWCGKTRMAWLRDGEKNLKMRLFVLTECTNVTDTQTNRHRMTT